MKTCQDELDRTGTERLPVKAEFGANQATRDMPLRDVTSEEIQANQALEAIGKLLELNKSLLDLNINLGKTVGNFRRKITKLIKIIQILYIIIIIMGIVIIIGAIWR